MPISVMDQIWIDALAPIRDQARAGEFEPGSTVALPSHLTPHTKGDIRCFLNWIQDASPNALASNATTPHLRSMWTHPHLYVHQIRCLPTSGSQSTLKANQKLRSAAIRRFSDHISPERFTKLFGVPPAVFSHIFRSINHLIGPERCGTAHDVTPAARLLLTLAYLRNGEGVSMRLTAPVTLTPVMCRGARRRG